MFQNELVVDEGRTVEEIYDTDFLDDKTHAVVHGSKEYVSYNSLQNSLIDNFVLEGDERCYFFAVKSIDSLLVIVPDLDGRESLFFAVYL